MAGTDGVMEETLPMEGEEILRLGFIHFMLLWVGIVGCVTLFRPVRHGHQDWKFCLVFLLFFPSLALLGRSSFPSLVLQFGYAANEAFLKQ